MEVVEEFKEELHSLYNTKLPVSRAKIASVTKLAMKSIKHYKHIVMIVEKFIAKSSAPYKLPALYVIDSIVRQSKHQFNESKEMYGPRFGKRLDKIFSMLYQCTEADKPKIIRVLNLWQKNSVFPSEVLQPLLDQAPPPPSNGSPQEQPSSTQPILNEAEKKGEEKEKKDEQNESLQQDQIDSLLMEQQDQLQNLLNSANTGTDQSGMLEALIDKAKQLQDLQALQQKIMKNSPSEEKGVEGRGGEMKREEITAIDKAKMSQSSMVANEFSKALLDNFDYSSDEEGDVKLPAPAISNDNSDASAIIDQLEEQFKREKEQELVKVSRPSRFHPASPPPPPPHIIDELTPPTSYRAPPIPPPPPPPPPPRNLDWRPPPDISRLPPRLPPPPSHLPPPPPPSHLPPSHLPPRMQNSWREEREWSSYSHSHSRRYSRSPSPRRGHFPPPSPPPPRALPSRSFQRDRSPVHRYERGRRRSEESRYRGDERRDRDSRSRDNEREYESGHFRDRFRDRERESRRHDDDRDHSSREKSRRSRRSSSFSRSGFVTVKSKTVWIGHIIKGVSESQLSSMIEQFGKIKSIDFILARGCAYVVMETRDAAKKVVEDLKDPRVLGQKCKVAWAPGRGAKGQTFDRYWDAAVGVSVIPWEHVKSRSEVETLSNGGVVETSTLPPQLKEEVAEVDMED